MIFLYLYLTSVGVAIPVVTYVAGRARGRGKGWGSFRSDEVSLILLASVGYLVFAVFVFLLWVRRAGERAALREEERKRELERVDRDVERLLKEKSE